MDAKLNVKKAASERGLSVNREASNRVEKSTQRDPDRSGSAFKVNPEAYQGVKKTNMLIKFSRQIETSCFEKRIRCNPAGFFLG